MSTERPLLADVSFDKLVPFECGCTRRFECGIHCYGLILRLVGIVSHVIGRRLAVRVGAWALGRLTYVRDVTP